MDRCYLCVNMIAIGKVTSFMEITNWRKNFFFKFRINSVYLSITGIATFTVIICFVAAEKIWNAHPHEHTKIHRQNIHDILSGLYRI